MTAPDIFALGGRTDGDERIRSLFREWIAGAREYDTTDGAKDTDDRWAAVEDEIDLCPCDSVVALAIKVFITLRREIDGAPAPIPYIRPNPVTPWGCADDSILRGLAKFVPEIAELLAAVVHEDAKLIDAELGIAWTRDRLADAPRSEQHRELQGDLAGCLAVVASTEAKTDRGREIKARHAAEGALA